MPRARLPRGKKITEDKFFSMKENPEGASIGNAVNNVKRLPVAFKELGSAIKTGTVGQMMYQDMNPRGKAVVDALNKKAIYNPKEKKLPVRGRGRFQKFY